MVDKLYATMFPEANEKWEMKLCEWMRQGEKPGQKGAQKKLQLG